MSDMAVWFCRIGGAERDDLHGAADGPMREAVERAYRELTGEDPKFIFSGWGDKLEERELAVVEDREPDPQVIHDELTEHLRIVEAELR